MKTIRILQQLLLVGLLPLFLLAAPHGRAAGASSERVSLTVGSMVVVDVPFEIVGFRITDQDIVKGEAIGGRQLRLLGQKTGTTDIQVTGDGGVSQIYTVAVIENIKEVLAAMKRDLDTLPELELTVNRNLVVIKGEISSVDHWQLLKKVLATYEKQYLNLAEFRPAPEVMLMFKDALEKAGVSVVMEGDAPPVGTLLLKYSGNAVFIGGAVYSNSDIEKVKAVIAAQDWLALDKGEKGENSEKVRAVLNVRIEPVMLELDVVYVGVSDRTAEQIGTNLAKNGLVVIDSLSAGFQGELRGSSGWGGNYSINSGLQGALNFMASNGASRFRTAGHLTFKSNDTPAWRTFHSGGTLKVKISGTDGSTGSLQDIDYGLMMKVKGGLTSSKMTDLEVDLELSAPELMKNGDYDLKRNHVNTSVACELGKTYVMGGMKGLVQSTTAPSGVPFLRSIPVIQWFFSESEDSVADVQVLILLSPRLAGGPSVTLPVANETQDTEKKATESNQERMEKGGKKKRFWFF